MLEGLHQRLLGALPLGDVLGGGEEAGGAAVGVGDGGQAEQHRAFLAVGPDEAPQLAGSWPATSARQMSMNRGRVPTTAASRASSSAGWKRSRPDPTTTSALLTPSIRSAPGLNSVTRPSTSMAMIAVPVAEATSRSRVSRPLATSAAECRCWATATESGSRMRPQSMRKSWRNPEASSGARS